MTEQRTRSRDRGLSGTERAENRDEESCRPAGLKSLQKLVCLSSQEQTLNSIPPGRKEALTLSSLILKGEWPPNSGLFQSN